MAVSISATSVEVAHLRRTRSVKVNVLGLVDVNVGGRGVPETAPYSGSPGKLVNVSVLGRSGTGSASALSPKGSLVDVDVGRGKVEYAPVFAAPAPGNLVNVGGNDLAGPQYVQLPLYAQNRPYGRYRLHDRHRWGRHGYRHHYHIHGWDYGK